MLTPAQIQFLNGVCPREWTEENNIINTNQSVNIPPMYLTRIPIQFNYIKGHFECDHNRLTTLEGGPKEVDGYYSCAYNQLTNLIGAPEICNTNFWCKYNQLTSLEGCPKIIKKSLMCTNNPNLHILYGIGRVNGDVEYDNRNDLNEWIIEQARKDTYATYEDISRWIKDNNRLEFLLNAQQELREHFSPRILHLVDSGAYNESKILDYKTFKRIC